MRAPFPLLSCAAFPLLACTARPAAAPGTYVRAHVVDEPPPPATPAAAAPPLTTVAGPAPPSAPRPVPPAPVAAASKRAPSPPQDVVTDANRRAAQAPDASGYFNAIVQYSYEPGTLYQVYAAPTRITDVQLQPGERLVGPPACGDTVRWILAQGKSMDASGAEQPHIYIKPTRPGLDTNLVLNTDRHSYLLELHSYEQTYMAAVTWRFPQEEVAKLAAETTERVAQERDSAPVVSLNNLNFNYVIQIVKGHPLWTPLQVFDDGRKTFVRFPQTMLVREAPALFVLRDKETQLVNYRMKNAFYVIDRLIDSAELRVGGKDDEEIVRVARAAR